MNSALRRVLSFLAAVLRGPGGTIGRHPVLFTATLPLVAIAVGCALALSYVAALVPLTPKVADMRPNEVFIGR